MILLRSTREKGFSTRRKALAALFGLLLLGLGYAWYQGMAITRGIANEDMDWNGDGTVSGSEIAQAFYAVSVEQTREGARACNTFQWHASGEVIRVDCRTVVDDAAAE